MGLLILLVVGASLGWLASIVLQREDRASLFALASAGMGGAVVTGLVLGGANLLVAVGTFQLLGAILGAAAAIAAAGFYHRRSAPVRNRADRVDGANFALTKRGGML